MTVIKFQSQIINAKEDEEKLLLPGIVWIHRKDGDVSICWIGIGWWHYGIAFMIGIKW